MRHPWTDEESDYLTTVYTCPGLYKFWNLEAHRRGWPTRSDDAIKMQVRQLRKIGEVGSRRLLDEADGWISKNSLAVKIGVSESVVLRWIVSFGLEAYRDGSPNAIVKISLQSFVEWAVTPTGYGQLSKSLYQNPLGLAWVFRQIGEYAFGNASVSAPPPEPINSELSIEEAITYIKETFKLSEEEAIAFLKIESLIEETTCLKPAQGKLTKARVYRVLRVLK